MKKNKSFSNFISEGGLWDNIRKARAAGKPKKKPGQKGYPKTLDIEGTEGYVSHAQRAAVWANRADGGKGHPDNKKKKKSKKESKEVNELSSADLKLINKMYDKKGNQTAIGKKVMDHGKKRVVHSDKPDSLKSVKVITPKTKKEAYEPITTKRQQALAKAASEPKKPVTLPRAPWDKGTKVTYDKNGKVVKEISQKTKDSYVSRASGQAQAGAVASKHLKGDEKDKNDKMVKKRQAGIKTAVGEGAYDSPAKKKPVSQMSSAEKKANDERRKAYKDFQKSKRDQTEGAMKRMSTGDGMDTYRKKPDEVKSINKGLMKNRNNPQEKDKDVKKINKSLAQMRGEAFSARAIVKKPRAGDGKPMHSAPGARGPEHKAAVKKYVSGMKSKRPGNTTSTLPRQMKDPKKDAMVAKGGKVKVVDKSKEADHLKRGYVRAEQSDLEKTRSMAMQNKDRRPTTFTKSSKRPPDEMREAKTMMVTRPGSNRPIEITVDQWPSFKMRGYHHAEQKENMMTMKLINKMKKASPAAKKALEAPSRVDNKDDKKVNELTIDDVRKATEKAKKRQEKERKATGKTSTSTTDLASRNESFITEKAKSGLAAKAKKSGISQSVLRSVYNRGMAAWKSGHRPGTTPQQWAMARVNSFITKGSGTWGGADKDLAGKVRKEDVNPECECEDCQCNPCECGDWRANMGPGAGGIPTDQAEKLGEAKMMKICEDCGCKYGNIDPDCDCPNDGSDPMGEHWTLEPHTATEALDMKQRLARARSARKNKAKLAMGRKKAGRRIASMKVLKKRAQRAARKTLTKRLTKGIAKRDLTVGRKKEIEKKLDTKTFQVKANRLVKRTIKDIRKKEIARKRK